ncbi:hypothetical protein [Salinivirga cyanobacteriivorans]|uniref:N-acetyltransferase domain-containing protein n=1 Tax=Salinivirga cyanobacteriivorans TaxID=1307839 RepID=A0A0S2I231_9BACT|nr:hypothetical protein [Salinivirga cyanobacteriivorans]ALO16349.1 hypothetical protein L21SP5_02726 [Salinivirga cyanobacteriivorans]
MNIDILEWIGYLASILIAISMTMSSIVKFRVINLLGAGTFSLYGFLIGALPVGFMNLFIVLVDVYFLYIIFNKKEVFETLEVRPNNKYLLRYLKFHENEIQRFFPGFKYQPEKNTVSFFILRDMQVAGLFLAHREDDHVLRVGLDYVGPKYRDFKNGRYIYTRVRKFFLDEGFTKVVADANSEKYFKYLKKLGFEEQEDGTCSKTLEKTI